MIAEEIEKTESIERKHNKDALKGRILMLTMYGFKSFANKTTIPFHEGFNAIIGPNGSGKSNIMDAFVFVLGSSSREIRAGRLEHLIYNGGYGRKPSEFAEVEIHINNKDRLISEVDEDVIVISRKVTRKGNSYYKINGKIVTKEEMLEILDKIGLKPGMYNIIQQGDVINLIKMKPKERREIIDRVAGIDEYNKKKENALKELEEAEKNLHEAKLVLDQKKEFLDKLKYERDIALKVKELEEKKNALKAQLSYSRYKILENEIKKLEENIALKEREYINAKKKVEGCDLEIETLENEIKTIDEKLSKTIQNEDVKRINEVVEKIYERESKIKQNEKEMEYLRKSIENYGRILDTTKEGKEYEIVSLLKEEGVNVIGLFKDIISYDPKLSTAIEIAMGNHDKDVIVHSQSDALKSIRILKEKNLGRMRFLPLDRMEKHTTSSKAEISKSQPGILGLASELIRFDIKYKDVVDYVFKDTLIAETADDAKKIRGLRIVTLEGELFEPSGAIIGGSIKKTSNTKLLNIRNEIEKATKKIEILSKENEILKQEVNDFKELLENLKKKQNKQSKDMSSFLEKKTIIEEKIEKTRKERKQYYEKMLLLESEINNMKIRKARLETEFESLKRDMENYKDMIEKLKVDDPLKIDKLIKKIESALREIGVVNMKAIEDYEEYKKEYDEYYEKVKKLYEEKKSIEEMIEKIEHRRKVLFMEAFNKINKSFSELFRKIANGNAEISLERKDDIDSGLIIKAQPNGKKLQNIDSLSGGEKSLVSLTFLFAIMHYKKAPFYLLDEVDAALDKKNSEIIGEMIAEYSKDAQFIVISHNDITVQKAKHVYGVSMQKGISHVFSVVLHE